jgi:hypothetical protein
LHACDPPFQVMDIDLDVVRNRVGTRPGKLRSMVAILLAGELGM